VLHLIRGEWEEGSQEAELACSETLALDMNHTGLAFYELGEIRLRQGDLAAAAEAFRRANELGADALPGTALLRLAEGDADAAAAALASAVEDASSDRLRRARLLPALVEAALARGDIDTARLAASDLAEVAEAVDSQALRAAATTAHGATLIASGDLAAAQRSLRAGVRGWLELGAPHEAAQARLALARALAARGDQMSAVMEVEAALATFDRLGARRDRETAEDLLSELDRPAAIT
jgi:tetratricopeptide (TPR) repeat protein